MDEIFQKLLSSELLSEEAKNEISTQWNAAVDQYKTTVREEVTLTVRGELAEQWATERDALIENVEQLVTKKLTEECAELFDDVNRFRDLEAETAEKIVEAKHQMADQLAEELDALVDKIDSFFELRLTEEFSELKEDLEIVKQNEFGRKIYEAFATEFGRSHIDESSIQSKLAAAVSKLDDATKQIAKLEESNAKIVRESKLEKILAPLSGKKREQMQFVLSSVETPRLEEAYNTFIGRILKEDTKPEAKPLNESVVVTGEPAPTAVAPTPTASKDLSMLRKLAGI